jgi:pimeloyl-ACP methyl ester carboxylesterase
MHKSSLVTFILGALALGMLTATAEPFSDRITVTVRGKGPNVLLIPGLTCSSAVWNATAKQLESRYRLHLVQVAGFAGAPARANAKEPILQPIVAALDAYLKTNNVTKPAVIGHSMGGLLGMMLALQHPEDCGKLMIVDSLPFFSVVMGAKDASGAQPQATAIRDMILAESQADYARTQQQFLRSLVKSPEGLKAATQWATASDKAVVARATYELMTTDLRPKLRDLKTPVTMLYPWDPASGFPQAATDRLYQSNFSALPNKTLARITNSFHFIMFDQPEAFAAHVRTFLD